MGSWSLPTLWRLVERAAQVPAVHPAAEGRDRPGRVRGDRSVGNVCRDYRIAETLCYQWRARLLEGGKAALANPGDKTPEQTEIDQLRRKVGQWSGPRPRELRAGGGGGTLAGLGVSERVARSRAVVAVGDRPVVVARVAGVSRQALHRRRQRRPVAAGPGASGPDDRVIVEVAKANPSDGTHMVAALASRALGRLVNRKRVQRVMRAHRLLQPSRSGGRRRRPRTAAPPAASP